MAELKLYKMVLGQIQTNVYLLMNEETHEVIIVDPADEAQTIIDSVREIEGKPVAIYLTHGHHDHMEAADAVRKEFGIPVIAHEDEQTVLNDPSLNGSGYFGPSVRLQADITVKDNDKLDYAGFDCRVMHTPGHTWGSVCYYFPEHQLLLSGDTLFQFSYGRVDFATSNPQDMKNSIKRILTEIPEDVTACPGHMGYTTIEAEKRYNPLA